MSYGKQCDKLNSSQNCVVLDLNGFLINQKQFSLLYFAFGDWMKDGVAEAELQKYPIRSFLNYYRNVYFQTSRKCISIEFLYFYCTNENFILV